jgi:succinate dehydrogenase/fumarate reductase-like Fe-S protein
MVEALEEICTLMFEEICRVDVEFLNNPNVIKALENIKKAGNLHPRFNLAHRKDNHQRYFYIKNCQQIHCFECLVKEINENRSCCEHNAALTKSEIMNIRVLSFRV